MLLTFKSFGSLMFFLAVVAAVSAQADWRTCGTDKGLTRPCGQIISSNVILNEGPVLSRDCCTQLVRIGKPCHDAFVQAHIDRKDYEDNIADVIKRRDKVWDDCVAQVKLPPPVPPPVPAPSPLN